MPTPAQIEEQVRFERDAIAQGLKKLRENTRRLEEKQYASATIYGVASIDTLLPLVVAEIERTVHDRIGRATGHMLEVKQYIASIEPLASGAITCKVVFDRVFARAKGGDIPNLLISVSDGVGQAVENECQMRYYEETCPGLLNYIKDKYHHKSCGTQQRMTITQTIVNRYGAAHWKSWGQTTRIKLGAWLIDCLCRSSGWFHTQKIQQGNKTPLVLDPTPQFLAIKDQVVANSELFSPEAWPMLIEPNNWDTDHPGGYLLNEVMRGHEMVRRSHNSLIQGDVPYEFLNKIQKVAYTLNPFVVDVARTLYDRGHTVSKFIPVWNEEPPPVPPDIENDEVRKNYRRAKAEWHNRQNDNAQRCVRTRKTMEAVSRFEKYEKFYLPWSFDYRGRAYPIPAFLTPHDTNFGKSLLTFYDKAFLTPEGEDWIKFQVATTYGLDKSPIRERLDWVDNNHELITLIACDPIGNIGLWEGVDEPWLFLAACDEMYHCLIECDRQWTSLPIAVDATCSGVQVLAGLAKDASAARLVNVLPGPKPEDAYLAVANVAMPNIPERLRPYTDRKTTKRTVMTLPYNSKPHSNRQYIREAYIEAGIEPTKDELTEVVKAVRSAMKEVLPGPMDVMEWIEKEVGLLIKSGKTELQWTTPSGFEVTQKFMKQEVERINLQVMGRVQMSVATGDTDKVDISHHRNATSPNLIHSLDASLLHLSAIRFDAPISLIHDSVLCRATDMDTLSRIVRETYMDIFADNDYLKEWAKQIGAITEPPMINTLQPELVIESTYFFC